MGIATNTDEANKRRVLRAQNIFDGMQNKVIFVKTRIDVLSMGMSSNIK